VNWHHTKYQGTGTFTGMFSKYGATLEEISLLNSSKLNKQNTKYLVSINQLCQRTVIRQYLCIFT